MDWNWDDPLTLAEAAEIASHTGLLERAAGLPFGHWAKQCHAISLELVKSGLFGPSRVARGHCAWVGVHQHSWIVLDHNVYNRSATIVDPTLWSYSSRAEGVLVKRAGDEPQIHQPHGTGNIWHAGRPPEPREPIIRLRRHSDFSQDATLFLELLGPLDRRGWSCLASGVMQGWPAGEIIGAMLDTPELAALVPIDIAGMVTDTNPGGLYLPEDDHANA